MLRKSPFKRKTPWLKHSPRTPKVALSKRVKPLIWSMKQADEKFSRWVRKRDGRCARCGTTKNLTCSHFWARQHKATRYDPENCVAVCWMPCHKYHWEKEKQGDYRDFMLKRLGKKGYDNLEKKARSIKPLSDAIVDCMRLLREL